MVEIIDILISIFNKANVYSALWQSKLIDPAEWHSILHTYYTIWSIIWVYLVYEVLLSKK